MKTSIAILLTVSSLFSLGCKNQGKTQSVEAIEVRPVRPIAEPIRLSSNNIIANNTNPTTIAPTKPVVTNRTSARTSGKVHIVKKNDTLYSISRRYLGKGARFTEILEANPAMNGSVNIRPGQKIIIP